MSKLAQKITDIIDFFYPPFSRWMSRRLFRYAACGGGNLVLDWVLYFITYNFIVGHDLVYFQLSTFNFQLCLTPHIAALCIVFPITLLTGFWLQKNVTFVNVQSDKAQGNVQRDKVQGTKDKGQGKRQLFRYTLIVAVNLAINYFGLKLCVETLGWYPTPSKIVITLFTVIISYIGQKYYTFRVKKEQN